MLITADPHERAFRAGIRAGDIARQQLTTLPAGTSYLARLQYFWLKVGTALPSAVPDPTQEHLLEAFVEGAAASKPMTRLVLTLNTTIAPPDHTHTDADADEDAEPDTDTQRRVALAAALQDIAQQIHEGVDNGPVRLTRSWLPIGDLTINLWI